MLIDVEAYQANAHLIPKLDRLSPHIRRNMTEAGAITALTMPANLAGLPALVLPIPGPVPGGPAGLPASLQLIGPPGGEEQLIALGRVIETALR